MEKVKLPRHVAEALEKVKKSSDGMNTDEFIAWFIPDRGWAEENGEAWVTLHEYGDERGNFFKLIDALRYGYEIEPEPITVTITAEMQEKIRRHYESIDNDNRVKAGRLCGIRETIDLIGIKIPGVNA